MTNADNENLDQTRERTTILLNEARFEFNLLHSSIQLINDKLCALFQIFLVIVTIEISTIAIAIGFGKIIGLISYFLIILLILISSIAILSFAFLIWPKKYDFPDIFDGERYSELLSTGAEGLVSDFLSQIVDIYPSNEDMLISMSSGLKRSILLIITNIITFWALICLIGLKL